MLSPDWPLMAQIRQAFLLLSIRIAETLDSGIHYTDAVYDDNTLLQAIKANSSTLRKTKNTPEEPTPKTIVQEQLKVVYCCSVAMRAGHPDSLSHLDRNEVLVQRSTCDVAIQTVDSPLHRHCIITLAHHLLISKRCG